MILLSHLFSRQFFFLPLDVNNLLHWFRGASNTFDFLKSLLTIHRHLNLWISYLLTTPTWFLFSVKTKILGFHFFYLLLS